MTYRSPLTILGKGFSHGGDNFGEPSCALNERIFLEIAGSFKLISEFLKVYISIFQGQTATMGV